MNEIEKSSRRSFIGKTVALSSALALTSFAFKPWDQDDSIEEGLYMIGPRKGYTPLIGTLVSMLENMTTQVKQTIQNLTIEELDHQFDENANTIGALILHITSSEKFHQIGTLENRPLNEEELKFWYAARNLSDPSSKTIKGNKIEYYLQIMDEVRKDSLAGLKEKDDTWLLSLDETISTPETPINKFWRWFHACEHMSNHNGQIKFLKSRLHLNKKE
ncbi:DinB family protein [Aegicerativicinus sediminis]|uniref:DinB family protein n=1 Tax=Aegicerativicinus sediminis TaxID=2893202 RepID=UPI001E2C8EE8|nr:DinB family protein [Aegicerativicinus sediminis]